MRKTHKEEKGRNFPNGRQSWVIGDRVVTNQEITRQETDSIDLKTDLTEQEMTRNSRAMTNQEENLETDLTEEDITRNGKDLTDEDVTGVDNFRTGRGIMTDLWTMGDEALSVMAEHALESENKDNGIKDKSSFEGDGLFTISFL